MFENKEINYTKQREFVGKLILNVLIEQISVKKALLLFPKDIEDVSIQIAWHALCHFEADEDIRKQDELYEKEQIDYLEFISNTLQDGEELPKNIIDEYKKYYKDAPVFHENNLKGIYNKLKRIINL